MKVKLRQLLVMLEGRKGGKGKVRLRRLQEELPDGLDGLDGPDVDAPDGDDSTDQALRRGFRQAIIGLVDALLDGDAEAMEKVETLVEKFQELAGSDGLSEREFKAALHTESRQPNRLSDHEFKRRLQLSPRERDLEPFRASEYRPGVR